MKALHKISFILLIIGGLNWGIYGITGGSWEVGHILGGMTGIVSIVVYILVGLAAIVEIFGHKSSCMYCQKGGMMMDKMDKGMMMKDGMMDKGMMKNDMMDKKM